MTKNTQMIISGKFKNALIPIKKAGLATLVTGMLTGLNAEIVDGGGGSNTDAVNFGSPTSANNVVSLPKTVLDELKVTGGKYTPALRQKYLEAMERSFHQAIKEKKATVSKELVEWLNNDPALKEELLSLYYPLDMRVFENLDKLRIYFSKPNEKLNYQGKDVFEDYKELFIAAAVSRRDVGLGSVSANNDKWPDAADAARYPESGKKKSTESTRYGKGPLAQYLRKHFEKPEDFAKVSGRLAEYQNELPVEFRAEAKSLLGELEHLFKELGYVPAQRDTYATSYEFLEFLIRNQELSLKDESTDVYFHFKDAPWPTLLGLTAMTRPLREAEYIWEKYLGKHGEEKLHIYGPYRHAYSPERHISKLTPSKWAHGAILRDMEVGGVCGTMSRLSKGMHVCLGRPVSHSGQTNHANLIVVSYDKSSRQYYSKIAQSITIPFATTGSWHFADNVICRPVFPNDTREFKLLYHSKDRIRFREFQAGAEHILGSTLAMNGRKKEYFDTKMLVNIQKNLPLKLQKEYGPRLMRAACSLNAYNPEPWYIRYFLADREMGVAVKLISELREVINLKEFGSTTKRRRADEAVMEQSHSVLRCKKIYTDALSFALLKGANVAYLRKEPKDLLDRCIVFVKNEQKHYSQNIYDAILVRLYAMTNESSKTLMAGLEKDILVQLSKDLSTLERINMKKDKKTAAAIKALLEVLSDGQAEKWARHLESLYTKDSQKYYVYNLKRGCLPIDSWKVIVDYLKTNKADKVNMRTYWNRVKPEVEEEDRKKKERREEMMKKKAEDKKRKAKK